MNSPYIYYNLSNAYYRNGNLGKAIVNIEKASKLAPRDKYIKSNMKYLHDIAEHVKQTKTYDIFLQQFSLNELTIVSSAVLILFVISLSLFIIKRNLALKKVTAVSIILLIVCIPLFGLKDCSEFSVKKAVVWSDTSVRSDPSENNSEIFTIPEGKIVSITAEVGNWINI